MKVSPSFLPFAVLFVFSGNVHGNAQSVPCYAITRNPLVLEALLDSHSQDTDSDLQDATINAAELEHLQFNPIVIQPGDALYMEYRGKDFTVDANFASGERTAFDSSPKGSYEQWRKGILPLDMFREALSQRLVRLRATAKNPNQVLFRNIKIIRAGKPIFEFASLESYGKPQVKSAVERQLPCVGFDDVPPNGNSTAVNYSFRNPTPLGNFSGGLTQPMLPPFPMMMQSSPTGTDANHYKFTGKELDDETGLYNYGARYYSPALGRFMTPDWSRKPVPVPYANLKDPQTLNLYAYVRNNPVSLPDLDGHAVQLSDNEDERKRQLAAFQKGVGATAGKYLYDNAGKDGHHYLGILKGGPDGKGPDFGKINGATSKLNGIIQDQRTATVSFVHPSFVTPKGEVIGEQPHESPAATNYGPNNSSATIYVTSGDFGESPASMLSNHKAAEPTLADILFHEMGHVDSHWFFGGQNNLRDSVQTENEERKLNNEPSRLFHSVPGDTDPH